MHCLSFLRPSITLNASYTLYHLLYRIPYSVQVNEIFKSNKKRPLLPLSYKETIV